MVRAMEDEQTKQKRKEALQDLFHEMSLEDCPILVEGLRDRLALVMAGIDESHIIMLHGKPLYEVEEHLETHDRVILLLDYDREGKKLFKRFRRYLQKHKVRIINRYRRIIYQIFDGHLDCIEHLRRYFT